MSKPKKRKLKKGYRILRGLYRFVLAVSMVIVALYIAVEMAFQAPEIAKAGETKQETQGEDLQGPAIPSTDNGKSRRDHVYTFLLAATDDGNGNADTIMVMTYDVPNKKIGVISIPRDTLTEEHPKINAAMGRGVDHLRTVVADLLGIPIDYYITVDLEGFVQIVDKVGGVDFYVPCNMNYDDTTPGKELRIHYTEGMQHLTGQQAMEVVRFRHNNDYTGYNDTGRAKTQRDLITTVAKKLVSWNNLTKVDSFVKIFYTYVETNLDVGDMGYFAKNAISLNMDSGIVSETLPTNYEGNLRTRNNSWVYQLDPEKTLNIVNTMLNPYEQPLTLEDMNIVQAKPSNLPAS